MASRGEARDRKTTEFPNSDPSRRDTTSALRGKRHFARAQARISHASAYFTRSKIVFHRAASPRFVPGCRLAPIKIAASGARALLAMTNLAGFAEKRNIFWNETFEKRRRAASRKNDFIKQKRVFSKHKAFHFYVIARPQGGRGNL